MSAVGRLLLLLCAFLLAGYPLAGTAQYEVSTPQLQLRFADNGDLIEAEACLPDCAAADTHRRVLGSTADPLLSFTSYATEPFVLRPGTEGEGSITVLEFASPDDGSLRRWRIPASGYRLELEVAGSERLDLGGGRSLAADAAAGFGQWLERTRYVVMREDGVEVLGLEEAGEPLQASRWIGLRNRHWAVLARPAQPAEGGRAAVLTVHPQGGSDAVTAGLALDLPMDHPVAAPGSTRFDLYLGPVEPGALKAADPALHGLLYASLWFWLRWICIALFALLLGIHALLPVWGLAIIMLAAAVTLLMKPLSLIADRLQDQVQHANARLGPELRAIKQEYRGEEQSRRVLALYAEHGVHPLYALKSLAGVAVVLPVFIGAFDMLAENIWLSGESFLWITDLAHPDAIARLPIELPFFGATLNLLPFLMTALSVLASLLHQHAALDAVALRAQRRNLTLMALAFLALFYTFPAGMVLYWTTNNAISALRYGWRRWRGARKL